MKKMLNKLKEAMNNDNTTAEKKPTNLFKPSITSEIKSMLEELSQNIEEVRQITAT